MPLLLDDPDLSATLIHAGVLGVHEPFLPFLADGTVDLDQVVAVATNARIRRGQPGYGKHASMLLTQTTYLLPPSRFEAYLEDDGLLGGFVPLGAEVWAQCSGRRMKVICRQVLPHTTCIALCGRPLEQLVDHPAFAGRRYVIEDCDPGSSTTIATCRVGTLGTGAAVTGALALRASNAAAPVAAAAG